MPLIESQHRPGTVTIDFIHGDLELLAGLEFDVHHELVVGVALNAFDEIDLGLPVLLLGLPGFVVVLDFSFLGSGRVLR
jgi:hypothetical protein